jgi:hypothetical protein
VFAGGFGGAQGAKVVEDVKILVDVVERVVGCFVVVELVVDSAVVFKVVEVVVGPLEEVVDPELAFEVDTELVVCELDPELAFVVVDDFEVVAGSTEDAFVTPELVVD